MNLADAIAALPTLSVAQLRNRYAEIFGETTNAAHKMWLIKRVAWRLQALAEGDLSLRARQRAADLANDADLRLSPPSSPIPANAGNPAPAGDLQTPIPTPVPWDCRLPLPGGILTRHYKG